MTLKLVPSAEYSAQSARLIEKAQLACARDNWDDALIWYEMAMAQSGSELDCETKGEIFVCIAYCHLNKGRYKLADESIALALPCFKSEDKKVVVVMTYIADRKTRVT
jgi:hypothetical protein